MNPSSIDKESSTWNPESIAWNPESKSVLDSLTWDELVQTTLNLSNKSRSSHLVPIYFLPHQFQARLRLLGDFHSVNLANATITQCTKFKHISESFLGRESRGNYKRRQNCCSATESLSISLESLSQFDSVFLSASSRALWMLPSIFSFESV